MKITKTSLMEIIREEYRSYINEVGMCHNAKGHFDDCKSGNVYSLTKKGARDNDIDSEYAQRGTLGSKEKNKPPKVSAKYGLNTSKTKSGGRKTIDGDNISPKFKVKDYPERYDEDHELIPSSDDAESDRLEKLGYPKHLQALGHGIIRADEDMEMDFQLSIQDIVDIVKQVLSCPGSQQPETTLEGSDNIKAVCNKAGYIQMGDAQARVLQGVSNAIRASKGEIGVKAK